MVIASKIEFPFLEDGLLYRDDLVGRLSQGAYKRLIYVSGPAGSGKTSLVSQWIDANKVPAVWYSIDKSDNDHKVFLEYFLAALGKAELPIKDELGRLESCLGDLSPQAAVSHIINILSRLESDLWIALDNYHVISSDVVHEAVSLMLDHLPPKVHLVLMTRRSVPLPVWRLKSRNQMIEIGSQDIEFSYKDITRFFQKCYSLDFSAGQVQELNRHLGGWATGLRFFGMAYRKDSGRKGFKQTLSNACHDGMRFLDDEVLSVESEDIRQFLYAVAPLDRFNVELCNFATGCSDGSARIDYLKRNDLFLVSCNDENDWYRFHPILSSLLKEKAVISSSAAFRNTCKKATFWFVQEGLLEEAFHYAFASMDMEFTADILEDHLVTLYKKGDVSSCRQWIARVPRGVMEKHPLLRLHEFRFRMWSVRLHDMETVLGDIEDGLSKGYGGYDQSKRDLCYQLLSLFRTILPCWLKPENVNVGQLENIASALEGEDESLSRMVRMMIVSHHISKVNITAAIDTLNAPTLSGLHPQVLYPGFVWLRMMATVERFQGHLIRSEALVRDAFLQLDRMGLSRTPRKLLLFLPLGWVAYMKNDLDVALRHTYVALRYAEQLGVVFEVVEANYLLALIYQAKGDKEMSYRCISKMGKEAVSMGVDSWIGLVEAYSARLYLSYGEKDKAEEWAQRRKLMLNEPFSMQAIMERLLYAEVICGQEKFQKALRLLKSLRLLCIRHHMMETVIEVDLIMAKAFIGLGDRRHGAELVDHALSLGKPEGYIRPFVAHGSILYDLYTDRAVPGKRGIPDPYINQIIGSVKSTYDKEARRGTSFLDNKTELTKRELDIVKLMADGYDNRGIAEKAFISINTVKTHAKHIFAKLDARTRVQAIKKVKELEQNIRT